MFCESCGKEIGTAEVCPDCGARQRQDNNVVVVVDRNGNVAGQKTASNPPAVIGFILGIASLFSTAVVSILSLIPGLGPFLCALVPFFPLTGLILSIVGLIKSKSCHKGKGLSIAGIIISSLHFVVALLFTIFVIVIILFFSATIMSLLGMAN